MTPQDPETPGATPDEELDPPSVNPFDEFDAVFGTGDEGPPDEEPSDTPVPAPSSPPVAEDDLFPDIASPSFSGGAPGPTAADLDLAFALSVLHGGRKAVREATGRGVRPDRLNGDGRRVFEFVLEHVNEYGQTPTAEQVLARLALSLPATPPEGPPGFWAGEVLNRDLHGELHGLLEKSTRHLERRDSRTAFQEIQAWVKTKSLAYSRVQTESMHEHVRSVKERYLRRKGGERGILVPWTTVNDLTYGIYPEQVWLWVARSGQGKTWLAVAAAHAAWLAGKRVLFATTEMSQMAVVQRFVAFHLKLPYHLFNAGKLPAYIEERFLAEVESLFDDGRIQLIGGDFDFDPETYEAGIEQCSPDLSVLDGAYLLKSKQPGKSRTDMASEAFNEIQRIGKRQKVGQIITSQYNRGATADDAKSGSQEKVALSDAAVWNATMILGLAQTKDMRRDRVAQLRLLKNREGPLGDTITINFNHETMDFTEQRAQGESADDFATGVPSDLPGQGPASAPVEGSDPFGPVGGSGPLASEFPF